MFGRALPFLFFIIATSGHCQFLVLDDTNELLTIENDSVAIVNNSEFEYWYFGSGAYDSLTVRLYSTRGLELGIFQIGWAHKVSAENFLHSLQSTPVKRIELSHDTTIAVLERIRTSEDNMTSVVRPSIVSEQGFRETNDQSRILIALISGILLSLAAYNLLLFFSVRDRSYLYYVFRELIFLLLWLNLYEYLFVWFWPESPIWNKYSFWLIISLYGILTIAFSSNYLEIPKIKPRTESYFKIIYVGYIVFAVVGGFHLLSFILYNFATPFIFVALIIPVSRDLGRSDFRPLRYYKLAFGFFLVGVFISILSRAYILPINFFTQHAVFAGVVLDALFFSIGLADRINLFKSEAEKHKQQLAVEQAESRIIKSNLEEKELLLKEIHHRVKNNLQLIYSLLNLQKQHITEPNSLLAIENSQLRIKSMSLVHQKLYESEELKDIDLSRYLTDLIQNIIDTVLTRKEKTNVKLDLETAPISLDTAIPLGLIINELINNACKYAIRSSRDGLLDVKCEAGHNGDFKIRIRDSGPGIPELVESEPQFQSLGLQLVYDLVKQLKGSITYTMNQGSQFYIEIPNRNGHG